VFWLPLVHLKILIAKFGPKDVANFSKKVQLLLLKGCFHSAAACCSIKHDIVDVPNGRDFIHFFYVLFRWYGMTFPFKWLHS